MPDIKRLDTMSRIEINKSDRNTLVNINDVQVNTALPITRRMEKYLEQVKNPYCFKCGETAVKLEFAQNGKSLDQSLVDYFINLKNR